MTEKCLNPECQNQDYIRGLCSSCYSSAYGLIKRGKTTWEKLIAEGKAKEPGTARARRTKWLLGS